MQLRFQDKEHFFHDTTEMLRTGLPLEEAWGHLARGRDRAADAARIAGPLVNDGLQPALEAAGFSKADCEILLAGEQSGRLEQACRELAGLYAQLAAGRSRVIRASLYPLFILHLAAILLAIPGAVIDQNPATFFIQVAVFLGIAYVVAGGVVLGIWLVRRAMASSITADRRLARIPWLGGFFRNAALSRFCLVLSLGIRSADGVLASLGRAGRASGSASIDAASATAITAIRAGSGFAEALASTRDFPADLERAFHVAEASGRLESEISRWAEIYRTRLFQRIESLASWLPKVLYLFVVALTVMRIFALVSQVSGIYSSLLDVS